MRPGSKEERVETGGLIVFTIEEFRGYWMTEGAEENGRRGEDSPVVQKNKETQPLSTTSVSDAHLSP